MDQHLASDPRDLQRTLCAVADQARALDVRSFEQQERGAVVGMLIPSVSSSLAQAIDVFSHVLQRYEPAQPPQRAQAASRDFFRRVDSLMAAPKASQRVADLAFMARMELQRQSGELAALAPSGDAWKIISECGSSRRQVLKSATAVETALCEHEGLASNLQHLYVSELDRSLEVRRVYAAFRRSICGEEPPDASNVVVRLRHAAVGIAKLIGRDIYEDLRVNDRMQVRKLQAGLLEWLRGADGFKPRSGLRLWQDLTAFAELLVQVNNRAELCEHDKRVAAEVHQALFGGATPPDYVPEDLLPRLRAIAPRDSELESLVQNPDRAAAEWRAPLERLMERPGVDRPDERPGKHSDFI